MSGRDGYELDGIRVAQARIALRPEKPVTQQELADELEIHRVTLTKIENGQARVSLDLLERLSRKLDRSREWLQGEPDPVDDIELARERIATAMGKIADGFDDFTAAVELLEERARHAGEPVEVTTR